MLKSIRRHLAQERDSYKLPRRVRDLIPIHRIWKDGIFLSGKKYSKTYCFSDINYQVASLADKKQMFFGYSAIINGMDSNASYKITQSKRHMTQFDIEEGVLMDMCNDGLNGYRKEYNDFILSRSVGGNGSYQERYLTVSIAKRSIQEARNYFDRIGPEIAARFAELGSRCRELSTEERLRILHNFYRPEDSEYFHFDLEHSARMGHDFRDYICPDSMEKHKDYLMIGNRYARTFYLKDLASFIRDDILDELTSLNSDLMLSIDVLPIQTDEAVREAENKLLGVEKNMADWQRRQNRNHNYSAQVPYDLELQRKETTEMLNDLTTRDQRMMLSVITMVVTAETKEKLDMLTDTLRSIAQNRMCQIAPLTFQQMDGLNTVLPIGPRKINAFRTLTTESLAVFMPFKVQEIQEKGGMYFGENAISRNLLLCNKQNLQNQATVVFGVPGSGKSFLTKEQIFMLITNTDDDILICDPEGEYAPLVEAMGDVGTVLRIRAGGKDRLNSEAIRRMVTNPLLCAMICALHFKNGSIMSSERNALYEDCCKMLFDNRDGEREIQAFAHIKLSYEEKKNILSQLAYWMMKNGLVVAEKEEVISRIKSYTPSFRESSQKYQAEDLYQYFLERSGILRSPEEGKIDFIHKSFQDYLAAYEISNQNDWGFIASKAGDVNWYETLILAMGFSRVKDSKHTPHPR